MKICVVGLRGIPGIMGGIEKHCEQIYPRIAALDNDTRIVVTGRSPYLERHPHDVGKVHVVSLWALHNKYLETILHTLLATFYARFIARAGIIHIHAIGPGLAAPLARALGMKVLVTHHGADYQRAKWNKLAKWVLRLGERWSIAASHATVIVCASLCRELKQRYPQHAKKLLYIPNGTEPHQNVPVTPGRHPILRSFGLHPRSYVLSVGRLVPEKGFQDLVAAFGRLYTHRKLVIAGDADHPDDFSRWLRQQEGSNILFTGFQTGQDLAALYANAALFVLPSYHEGLPIAALEALGFGCPVLLSNIGPNLDIGLPPQCYFPAGDVSALFRKLNVADYGCYQADTRTILARFNWDMVARKTLSLYWKLPRLAKHQPLEDAP